MNGACSGSTTRGGAASHFYGLLLWIPINRVMCRGEDEGLTSADGDRLPDEDVRACLAAYLAQTRSRATARGSRNPSDEDHDVIPQRTDGFGGDGVPTLGLSGNITADGERAMGRQDRTDSGDPSLVEDDGVLDASDTLDDDRVADPLDTGVAAADRWAGANRFGTTPAEERAGESLEQLLAEEEPDIDPYAEAVDDEDDLTRRGYEREARAGRLVAEDEGFGEDEEADLVARDAGVDAGGASAEEAAVHVVDDPDGPGDGLLR